MIAWLFINAAVALILASAPAQADEGPAMYAATDVRRFGAICDGLADDTEALVRAGQAGTEIYVALDLTCRVTGPLSAGIRPGQRWHGGGTVTTDDGANFTVFSVAGKAGVTFDGIRGRSGLLGSPPASSDARFIEFISGAHRGAVLNARITGFQQAVRVHGSTNVVIENNEIAFAHGWGISIQTGADHAGVTGNRVHGTHHEHGIYVAGSPNRPVHAPLLRGNTISGSAVDGIKLTYANRSVVAGNTSFKNRGQGIYLTVGSTNADVRDNIAHSNGDCGILVFDATTRSHGNVLQQNTTRDNGNHGIAIRSSGVGAVSQTVVAGNLIEANGLHAGGQTRRGIVVIGSGSTVSTTIQGNSIRDQDVGVFVAGAQETVVEGNVCENCRADMIAGAVPARD